MSCHRSSLGSVILSPSNGGVRCYESLLVTCLHFFPSYFSLSLQLSNLASHFWPSARARSPPPPQSLPLSPYPLPPRPYPLPLHLPLPLPSPSFLPSQSPSPELILKAVTVPFWVWKRYRQKHRKTQLENRPIQNCENFPVSGRDHTSPLVLLIYQYLETTVCIHLSCKEQYTLLDGGTAGTVNYFSVNL